MLLGVIADDFTGASDIASTIAKGLPGQGGLRTAQFLGVPAKEAPPHIEAGVVALKTRSVPPEEAIVQSLAALQWLREQGCRQFIFKYCSTFDSTPRGNIGPVAEALANALSASGVAACPAFPGTGRTVYRGHLFVHDRLLNESGLEHHPLNPMTDADIRRWLARQSTAPVGLVAMPVVAEGSDAIAAALDEAAERGERLVIIDAICEADLLAIARACRCAPLLTGGSGIALGLPANFIDAGFAEGHIATRIGVPGPEAILAGSCSDTTRRQVDIHSQAHPTFAIDVERVMENTLGPDELVAFIREHEGRAPLVYSSGDRRTVSRLQARHGSESVSARLDRLFADTAQALIRSGVKRLVVAGGETSGAVVAALGLDSLEIGPEIDPGVPVLLADGAEPIALALKSGNFGAPDFFDKALACLEGTA